MTDVQMLIDNPETRDFKVGDVVTDDMIQELVASLTEHGCGGVELLLDVWRAEYKDRYAIAGFLKDKGIGSKRLISMPDRISNTINSEGTVLMRPSGLSPPPPRLHLCVYERQRQSERCSGFEEMKGG